MNAKDHIVFFVISSCAITASATWIMSERLRVDPIKAQLEKQLNMTRSSPVIKRVTQSDGLTDGKPSVKQFFSFRDPEGDARFLSYVVLETNASGLRITSSSISSPKADQIAGATTESNWRCGDAKYFVTLRAIISDAAGNASAPYDYTINCN
jgi:hypothetical protein